VTQDGLIADFDGTAEESFGVSDLLTGKSEDFGITPVQWCWELQGKIVAQSALGERVTATVSDLSPGCRDAELEGSGLFLGFPCRLRIFIHDGIRTLSRNVKKRNDRQNEEQG
jgi:hypothetical protein